MTYDETTTTPQEVSVLSFRPSLLLRMPAWCSGLPAKWSAAKLAIHPGESDWWDWSDEDYAAAAALIERADKTPYPA